MRWGGAAILLLGLALPGQVTIYSGLGPRGDRLARRLLEARLPDQPFQLQPRPQSGLLGTGARGLLLGVRSDVLQRLAAAGALVRTPITDLEPPYRGPNDHYAITLLSPYVIAFRLDALDPAEVPESWDDLRDPRYQGRLAVGTPQAMPDLWMTWIGRELRRGEGERRAVAWLTALDARIASYADTAVEVREALLEGAADVGILPRALLLPSDRDELDHGFPVEDIAVAGLGVARLAGELDPETAAVHGVIAGEPFSRDLAGGLQLMAAPRLGMGRSARPVAEQGLLDRLYPIELDPATRPEWFRLWEEEVRGRGRGLEDLSEFLDLILGVLLLVFFFFVYTRMRKEGRRARTE